ncbi:MAG: V-type ATPase subunit [Treponema sp.]|jgi:vacuolar-type H+-ATPase subunit C/Vma6|nr:V-type ATPase subunit [Treponema sp.]
MPGAGERAYAYSKACGIIGKSFVGKRLSALGGVSRLNELDRLIFPLQSKDLPGRELLSDIENRIQGRTVKQILAIVGSYANPPELLVHLLRAYEYSDLKTCINYLSGGVKTSPAFTNIGRFGTVRFEAFPDLAAMLLETDFAFLLERDDIKEIAKAAAGANVDTVNIETELDFHYYDALIKTLNSLSASDRIFAEKILAEEISLRNSLWALRLRTYYGKSPKEAGTALMDIRMKTGTEILPASDARASLDLPLDSRAPWKGWRWERFLNPEKPGVQWYADPRYFQNAASEHLYRLALRFFHRKPFSISAVFCFIKLKTFEEDLLTSVAEGLGLGLSSGDVFDLLEVQR